MMLVPRKNGFDLFDDFFRDDDFFTRKERNLMKTDIKDKKDRYEIKIDLPGYEKENIKVELKDGNLLVSASNSTENNEEEDSFVRRERFFGECSRSFYVGEDIKEEDINAEFKNGILTIEIPKKEEQEKLNEIKKIEIK